MHLSKIEKLPFNITAEHCHNLNYPNEETDSLSELFSFFKRYK